MIESVIIKAKKSQFLKTLTKINIAAKSRLNKHYEVSLEITVTDGKITFAVSGAIFSMDCETMGACKAAISFPYFFQIIKDTGTKVTEILFTKNSMKIGIVTIPLRTTFFEDDRILRTIDLPMNHTDADLLRMSKENYTWEELVFNKLALPIEAAEDSFIRNIKAAHQRLKGYGVTVEDLENLANRKIYGERK
jgi:hypothetical protein